MKTTKLHYCLYNAGLLETLTFCHKERLRWFVASENNRFVYSDYFISDPLPEYKRTSLI